MGLTDTFAPILAPGGVSVGWSFAVVDLMSMGDTFATSTSSVVPAPGGVSVTTVYDWIEETKRHLYSGQNEQRNKLSAAYASGDTTLRFAYDVTSISAGSTLAVDFELFYVWAVDAQNKTVTVDGGQFGSAPANHVTNSICHIRPKFSSFAILKALDQELADLSSPASGLYRVMTVEVTSRPVQYGYDLAGVTDFLGDIDLSWQYSASANDWTPINHYTMVRNANTTDFPSGFGFIMREGVTSGAIIRLRYKAPFGQLTTATTESVLTVTGLPESANDIPALGAAARLAAPREIKRNFTESQGDTRRAGEVPPGAVGNSGRQLMALHDRRVHAEATRLASQYPIRTRNR